MRTLIRVLKKADIALDCRTLFAMMKQMKTVCPILWVIYILSKMTINETLHPFDGGYQTLMIGYMLKAYIINE